MNQEDVLSRLIAASEDLTDRGMMNLQKLLEALVYAALRVQARAYRHAGEPGQRIREIGGLIRDLPEAAIPPEFRKVLEGAVEHYAAGAKGDLPYAEAPDIFVCRNCGKLRRRYPPHHIGLVGTPPCAARFLREGVKYAS